MHQLIQEETEKEHSSIRIAQTKRESLCNSFHVNVVKNSAIKLMAPPEKKHRKMKEKIAKSPRHLDDHGR